MNNKIDSKEIAKKLILKLEAERLELLKKQEKTKAEEKKLRDLNGIKQTILAVSLCSLVCMLSACSVKFEVGYVGKSELDHREFTTPQR